ncbi:MAG: ABC-type metal ion transporter, periplasmic subunit [Ilumatobacteraceae bacterium]|nr:ABC-type metal ion transporter, periplasmic subunit [Ilumatobacteraceae bacterium]
MRHDVQVIQVPILSQFLGNHKAENRGTSSRVAGLVVCVLALSACGSDGAAGSSASAPTGGVEPIEVVASTNVYGSVVEAVGGDRVHVTSLIDNANADPLEYETTAADALAVKHAALVVYNGNGYDTFMPQLIDAAGDGATVVDAVALSGLQSAADDAFNEHVFYDMATIQKVAGRVAEVLGQASPDDAAMFTANASTFDGQMDGLVQRLADIAARHSGERVAMTEPLAGYLTNAAGLHDVTPPAFSEAIEEGDDPSAAALADMLALFESNPVDVFILNTQTESAATDQVEQAAHDAGVPVVSMSETLTAPDYITWMSGQVDALTEALDGH